MTSTGCIKAGIVLHVGDTVTSPDGAYVLEVTSTGIVVTFQGSVEPVVYGLVGVTGVKVTPEALYVYSDAAEPYTITFPVVAVRLCVEDDGRVVVCDLAGNCEPIFSYQFVEVSDSVLSALEASLRGLQTRLRILRQTARAGRRARAPKQSGFPGADDEANEKVA